MRQPSIDIENQTAIPGWPWLVQRTLCRLGTLCDLRSLWMLVEGECGVCQGAVGRRVLPPGDWQEMKPNIISLKVLE